MAAARALAGSYEGCEQISGLLLALTTLLFRSSLYPQVVANDAQQEDGRAQQVAAIVWLVSQQLCDRLFAVLVLRDNVPEQRVEADGSRREPEAVLAQVDEPVVLVRALELPKLEDVAHRDVCCRVSLLHACPRRDRVGPLDLLLQQDVEE